MTLTEWAMMVALSLLWGGSFFFNGVAVKELPTITIVVARVTIAAFILVGINRFFRVALPVDRKVWTAFFAMGLLNNVVPFSLIVWGQSQIASGLASILNATTPLFTVIVAHYWTIDERLTTGRAAGVVMGLIGVAVMIGVNAFGGFGINVVAALACLAAALSYAVAGLFGRRFRKMGVVPLATATGQLIASSIMLFPVMLWLDEPWTLAAPTRETVAALLGIASLSTALAYVLYFRILASAGATNLLLVTFLIPVSAVVLGVAFLKEDLRPSQFVGMGLIGLGLAAIDGRPAAMVRRRFGSAAALRESWVAWARRPRG